MPLLSAAELQTRLKVAKERASTMRDLYQEAADIVLPNRIDFEETVSGTRREDPHVTTSFGQDQAHRFGRRAQDLMFPNGESWVEFVDKDGEPQSELADLRDKVMQEMRASNFMAVIGGTLLDLSIGTCGMSVSPQAYGNSCLRFRGLPLDNLYLTDGTPGRIGSIFREFKATPDAMAAIYPQIKRDAPVSATSERRTYTECHVEMPDPKGTRWQYALLDGQTVVFQEELPYPRFAVARWSVATEEVFGRGPALLALPDLRQLNHLEGVLNEAAEFAINPIFLVQSLMNFEPDKLRLEPGTFVPVDDINGMKPLQDNVQVHEGLEIIQRLEANIRSAFLDSVRDRDDPVVTATQAQIEFLDFVSSGVAQLTRFHDELVRPLMRSATAIILAKEPDRFNIKLEDFSIVPHNRLTKLADVNRSNALIEFLVSMDHAKTSLFNSDEILRAHFKKLGGDPNHINSDEQVEEQRAQNAQAEAAAAAGTAGGASPSPASPAVGAAAAAPVDIQQLLGGAANVA